MKVYQPTTKSFVSYDRRYGRSLTESTLPKGFRTFLTNAVGKCIRKSILEAIIRRLIQLISALENMDCVRLYSSSVLIAYEGDVAWEEEAETEIDDDQRDEQKDDLEEDQGLPVDQRVQRRKPWRPRLIKNGSSQSFIYDEDGYGSLVEVRLVDFAHSHFEDGIGPDEQALFGLRNMKKILEDILERC
ncbi:hypothetical protein HK102_012884 [Quaeritorhiza haematococci]|nr:hypothetical protein HK102_012884 [Quaeritorhiza haematococci]